MRIARTFILAAALAGALVAPIVVAEPAQAQGRFTEREVQRYTVQRGDTLSSIARAAGISLRELQSLNPGVDPRSLRVGQTVLVPARAVPIARISVEIDTGRARPGEAVGLYGSGFRPGERVRILVGGGPYDLDREGSVRADRRGVVDTVVDVPRWARPGDRVHIGLEGDASGRGLAQPLQIVGRGQPDREVFAMTGTLTRQGVECPVMRGDDGATYSLAGDLSGFRPGDRIEVEGRIAQMSICMQGTTIDVRRIRSSR